MPPGGINAISFAAAFWCLENTLGCSLISDLEWVREARLQGTSLIVHLPLVSSVVADKLATTASYREQEEKARGNYRIRGLGAAVKFGAAL